MKIEINADSEFQIDQIKDILFPALEKKEPDSSKRMSSENIETISGNKLKQQLINQKWDIDGTVKRNNKNS